MTAHCHEVSGAHLDIQIHQLLRVPSVDYPVAADILVTEFGRMAELFEVELILRFAFHIHSAYIPIALLRHGLRIPVRPCAKLRIAPPRWSRIGPTEGFPVRGVRTCRNR